MARRNNEEDVVYFEKRVVDVKGLIMAIVVGLIIIVGGGVLIFINRDKFDWNLKLPWSKDDEYEVLGDRTGENSVVKKTKNNKIVAPRLSNIESTRGGAVLKAYDLTADDKGYLFKIDFMAQEENSTLNIEKILIDGHDTTTTLTVSDDVEKGEQVPVTREVRILKTELDALDIVCFKKLTIYYRIQNNQNKNNLIKYDIDAYATISYDNTIKGLIPIYEGGDMEARYYQTLSDKDNIYIYFDFVNKDNNISKQVKIKKLFINGELYEYTDLNEEVYAGTEKVFYLTLPKNKVKKLDSFSVSFFIMNKNADEKTTAVYITPEYDKSF